MTNYQISDSNHKLLCESDNTDDVINYIADAPETPRGYWVTITTMDVYGNISTEIKRVDRWLSDLGVWVD